MIYDILAACIPIILFAVLATVVVRTTDPEEDTKFEDIESK